MTENVERDLLQIHKRFSATTKVTPSIKESETRLPRLEVAIEQENNPILDSMPGVAAVYVSAAFAGCLSTVSSYIRYIRSNMQFILCVTFFGWCP